MWIRSGCFLLFLVLLPVTASARNHKLTFAQIAVGDQYVTVIDLINNGVSTFYGTLELRDNLGNFLAVSINDTQDSVYFLSIQPKASQRLRLSRKGTTVAGHAFIWDNLAAGAEDYSQQINGNLYYQFLNGSTLLDSVGVPPSPPMEHFYFPAEYSKQSLTGIALSESTGVTITGTVRAITELGVPVTSTPFTLYPWNHKSVFLNEILPLPVGFRGTIQVESSLPVYPIALRMEGDQYTTVPVIPFSSIYDLTISLMDGRVYRGETTFSISDGSVDGSIRFINPAQDADSMLALKGAGMAGSFFATTQVSFFGRSSYVSLYSDSSHPVLTTMDSIAGNVIWSQYGALPLGGTFTGARRR